MDGTTKEYVRQLGAHEQCARKGCPVKAPWWRVILGHWHIQVYVCTEHLSWALRLEFLAQSAGEALGWEYGYMGEGGHVRHMRTTMVCHEMPLIRAQSGKFLRDVSGEISGAYPQFDADGFPRFHPESGA